MFLHSADSAAQRQNTILKKMIEAFWTHTRNLIEFLTHPKGNDSAGVASARDFAETYYHQLKMNSIDDLVNAQISHLTYERRSAPEEKLGGYDMLRVKRAIDSEIKRFESHLENSYRECWVQRPLTANIRSDDDRKYRTNHSTTIADG